MKYQFETIENKSKKIEHYKKINIIGEEGVGKSSLISLMEKFKDDNFVIKKEKERLYGSQFSLGSIDEQSNLVEQIKQIKIPINDDNPFCANVYETNLGNYDYIKMNLDTLLLQTECIIIMWDSSKCETFNYISNLFDTINQGMKDFKFRKAPIFLIENKSDLELGASQIKEDKNDIKNTIEKIKEENQKVIYRKISLLNKDDFRDLLLNIKSTTSYAEEEQKFFVNDAASLVKFQNYKETKDFEIIDYCFEINCILLGHSCVGKTTFFNFFLGSKKKTNITSSSIEFLKLLAEIDKEQFYVKISDTLGQERFFSIGQQYIRDADGILLFFDVTKKESFTNIDDWISKIKDINDKCEIILLANKIDESEKRKISKKEAKEKADEFNMKYYECCSLNGLNLYEILNEIILSGYKKHKRDEKDEDNVLQKKNTVKLYKKCTEVEKEKKKKCCYIY